MNNEIDLLDELDREERDERLATGGGGLGAALGVFLTLLIGCGLVFAAYKLGQRKNVDEPPLIAAADEDIKILPDNPGGSDIPNTDNLANAMIDGSRIGSSEYAIQDGVVVEAALPNRDIDQAASLEGHEIRREIVDLGDLAMKSNLEGEPDLETDGAADRSDEILMVDGAEVTPNANPTEEVLADASIEEVIPPVEEIYLDDLPDAEAQSAEVPSADAAGSVDTTIAAAPAKAPKIETANAFGENLSAPMPMRKPNVGPSVSRRVAEVDTDYTPALAPVTREPEQRVRQRVEPAIASRINPTPPPVPGQRYVQPQPQVPSPAGVRQVRIPPQPIGDAQVQLGAYASPNEVRARWQAMRSTHRDLLSQLGLQVLPIRSSDGREMFRMRVGPLRDAQMANQLCVTLRGRGVDCFVPRR